MDRGLRRLDRARRRLVALIADMDQDKITYDLAPSQVAYVEEAISMLDQAILDRVSDLADRL